MKKNNLGFTFIEILIVVTILIIISGVSITSFNKGFERQSLNNELSVFTNSINNLDDDLGVNITDYNIYLSTGSFYYYYTNNLYKTTLQNISFNSYTGTIKTNDTIKNNMDLNIYFNDKKIDTKSTSSTGSFIYNISNKGKYEFKSYIGEKLLNSINIDYYAKMNTKGFINLIGITDGDGNIYTGVIIQNNLGGKKIFTTMTGGLINSDLNLDFESLGAKNTLKLTNK